MARAKGIVRWLPSVTQKPPGRCPVTFFHCHLTAVISHL